MQKSIALGESHGRNEQLHEATPENTNNTMTYQEAIESTVSRAEAIAEIKRHGIDPAEFLSEIGDYPEYAGADVLAWLGY